MGSKGIKFSRFSSVENEEEELLEKEIENVNNNNIQKDSTELRSEIRNIERQLDNLIPQFSDQVFKLSDTTYPSAICTEIECLLADMNSKLVELGKISTKPELTHLHNFNRNYNVFKADFVKLKKKATENNYRAMLFSDLNKEKDKVESNDDDMDILINERNSLDKSHTHAENFIDLMLSTRKEFSDQNDMLKRDLDTLRVVSTGNFPTINSTLKFISRKKYRNSLILGAFIAILIICLFLYFNYTHSANNDNNNDNAT